MKLKVVKKDRNNKNLVLNIRFNDEDQAIVGNHTPEESEKIITSFIENANKNMNNNIANDNVITIDDDKKEHTYNSKNWNNQKFILNNGVLNLENDIDPIIDIKTGSLLIYDGYTVNLSKQQYENLKNAAQYEDITVAFDNCYFNDPINIGDVNVGIDKSTFNLLVFENSQELDEITEKRTVINITNGARISDLTIGKMNHVNVNCEICSGDEAPVIIGTLFVNGSASLYNCHISQLSIGNSATVDICCEVDNVCVRGIAYIGEAASIESIHIHAGGKITGHLDGIDITCDRPFRFFIEDGKTWIVG